MGNLMERGQLYTHPQICKHVSPSIGSNLAELVAIGKALEISAHKKSFMGESDSARRQKSQLLGAKRTKADINQHKKQEKPNKINAAAGGKKYRRVKSPKAQPSSSRPIRQLNPNSRTIYIVDVLEISKLNCATARWVWNVEKSEELLYKNS
ncbi:unnamed protein product [Dovyalis caffra]|uniref:Uncharacterized protein n=1 Tax=Dovyalis caffra TaxID=77055 RepID=A0AAV1QSL0_9ROSI|nr:unnamed protein product [Dovyalis caffra]